MDLFKFGLQVFVKLFLVINPIGMVAFFLAIAAPFTPSDRAKLALISCMLCVGVILGFGYLGEYIFDLMGVTTHDFRIAGGVLLAYIGFTMVTMNSDVQAKSTAKSIYDVFVFPLSIPAIAGPGAMATIALAVDQANTVGIGEESYAAHLILIGATIAIMAFTYLCFRLSNVLERIFGAPGLSIVTRIFGVLLMTMAAQMIMHGIKTTFNTCPVPAGAAMLVLDAPVAVS